MTDQELLDEAAANRVIERLESGARPHRLYNAGEEFACARHMRLLREINAALITANQHLIEQLREAGESAMRTYDNDGKPTDDDAGTKAGP